MKNDAKYPKGTKENESSASGNGGKTKNWPPYLIGGILGLLVVIFGMTNCWFGHKWIDATCTSPKTCYACGRTQGSVLGHSYTEATETKPKTCTVCGSTDGTVVSHTHDWVVATCTSPQYCYSCGETVGVALEHQWVDATYDSPKNCSLCGTTEGQTQGYPLTWCREAENSNNPNALNTVDVAVGTWTDRFGECHADAIKFWVNANMINTEYIVYDINSDYYELMLTMVNAAENAESGKNRIAVYADGVRIYQSGWITNDSRPVEQKLDVGGVDEIRIECDTESYVHCYCLVQGLLYR